jgi:hypothetical protein
MSGCAANIWGLLALFILDAKFLFLRFADTWNIRCSLQVEVARVTRADRK